MTAFYRDSPSRLWQEGSTCWAAATEAWTAVTKGQEHLSYIEILGEAKAAGATAWNGSLKGDKGVLWLAGRFNLQWKSGTGLAENASMLPRLKKSHVIFLYRKRKWKRSVHAVTVWGTDDHILAAMDPLMAKWTFDDPASFDNSWELCLWEKD